MVRHVTTSEEKELLSKLQVLENLCKECIELGKKIDLPFVYLPLHSWVLPCLVEVRCQMDNWRADVGAAVESFPRFGSYIGGVEYKHQPKKVNWKEV